MASFKSQITMEQTINILNAFKKAIYNVNYVNNLIIQQNQNIIDAGQYASVLKSDINTKFPNNDVDISIANIPLDKTSWTEGKIYFESLQTNWSNQKLNVQSNFNTIISGKETMYIIKLKILFLIVLII